MIKIFINDSKADVEDYVAVFNIISEDEKLDITAKDISSLHKIPRGYDIYLIHFQDIVDIEEAKQLREEQPWSGIHYIFDGGRTTPDLIKLGYFYDSIGKEDLRRILEKYKQMRQPKK